MPEQNEQQAREKRKQIEEAVTTVRRSGYIKMERIQAFLDGVVLAAEQVQDKRIELLENGPELTTSDILIDFLIVFCLESSVAGTLISAATKKIIGPILKTQTLLEILPDKKQATSISNFLRYMDSNYPTNSNNWLKTYLGNHDYVKYCTALTRSTEGIVLDTIGLIKGIRETAKGIKESSPSEYTDSPGVGILSAAQSYASHMRLGIAHQTDVFEMLLRTEEISIEEISLFLEFIQEEELKTDLNTIRNNYKMIFEAIIWARLFEFHKRKTKEEYNIWTAEEGIGGVTTGIEGINSKPLIRYWIKRFGKFIEEWVRTLPQGQKEFFDIEWFRNFTYLQEGKQVEGIVIFFKYLASNAPGIIKSVQIG